MRKLGTRVKKLEKILYYPKKNYHSAIGILKLLAENDFLTTNSISDKLGKKWEIPHSRIKFQMEYLVELGYCLEYGLVSNAKHTCDHCGKSYSYLIPTDSIKRALQNLSKNKKLRDEAKITDPEKFNPTQWFQCEEGNVLGRLIWLSCSNCYKTVQSHGEEQYKIRNYRYWSLSNNGLYVMLGILKKESLYKFVERFKTDRVLELINVLLKSQRKEDVDQLVTYLKLEMKIKSNVTKPVTTWFNEVIPSIRHKEIDPNKFPLLSDYKNKHSGEWIGEDLMNARRFR